MKRIFVGPKQTTIENSNFFDESITLFGNGIGNNTSYKEYVSFEFWNPDNLFQEINIYNRELTKIKQRAVIMAYNPRNIYYCSLPENIQLICKNEQLILDILDNKIHTRNIMKNVIPLLEYYTIKGADFEYQQMKYIQKDLVIQLPEGSGGSKTFLCNKKNFEEITSMIESDKYYLISPYQRVNVPYNIHCIIGKEQIEILSPSQQKIHIDTHIEYCGSSYDIKISKKVKEKLASYSNEVCKKVQKMGYLGVIGIDFIEVNGEIFFIEINPRFQGSTPQIDLLLKKSNLPSIFDYNYRAFENLEMPSTKNMINSIFIN